MGRTMYSRRAREIYKKYGAKYRYVYLDSLDTCINYVSLSLIIFVVSSVCKYLIYPKIIHWENAAILDTVVAMANYSGIFIFMFLVNAAANAYISFTIRLMHGIEFLNYILIIVFISGVISIVYVLISMYVTDRIPLVPLSLYTYIAPVGYAVKYRIIYRLGED